MMSSILDKLEMLVGGAGGEGQLGVCVWSTGVMGDGLGLGAHRERRGGQDD